MPARSALAWSAVSRSSAAGTTQVISMRPALRLDSTIGSAAAPTKTAPAQWEGWDGVPWMSDGRAAAGSSVQKSEARCTGRMIPVITSCTVGPMFRRAPTRRPSLAAVAVVTAACTASPPPGAMPPDGRCPATVWL